MQSQLSRALDTAHHLIEKIKRNCQEAGVPPEVMERCVADCLFAPQGKAAAVAWFVGYFDETYYLPHRYDFQKIKGIPEYYHLGYEFAYVYGQNRDAARDRQEAVYAH